jgi:hypothetical protein
MKLQNLCQTRALFMLSALIGFSGASMADSVRDGAPVHDYPTVARVEYVNECIAKAGGKLAAMYQCSCAIDRIANTLAYDDFVEASTFAKYSGLPGQGGSIFRDSDTARKLAKSFRELEAESLRSCGVAR